MTQDAAHQTLTQPCELTRLQRQMKERLWNVLSYDAARGPQEDMDTQRMPLRSQAPDPLGRPQGGQPAPDRASRCPGPLTSPELSPPAAHPATRLQRSARHDAGFALWHGSNLVTFFFHFLKMKHSCSVASLTESFHAVTSSGPGVPAERSSLAGGPAAALQPGRGGQGLGGARSPAPPAPLQPYQASGTQP